jgi:putative holliday junction resolvase
MRILGIDYGTVRVGLALSDESRILATPLETVENGKAFVRISQVVQEKKIETVVLGMPRNMDGSYGPKADEVRKFAETLKEKVGVQVKFWDERLTTQGVERMLIASDVSRKKRKEVIDKLAAQQILQNYLDSLAS